MEDIILVGYGGHAKSVADCIERQKKYHIIGYTEPKEVASKYPYLGTDVMIGKMCIVNTKALIEHDCLIDEFTHIAVGATICGQVSIGKSRVVARKNMAEIDKKSGTEVILCSNHQDNRRRCA